jgi:hypothetical protein
MAKTNELFLVKFRQLEELCRSKIDLSNGKRNPIRAWSKNLSKQNQAEIETIIALRNSLSHNSQKLFVVTEESIRTVEGLISVIRNYNGRPLGTVEFQLESYREHCKRIVYKLKNRIDFEVTQNPLLPELKELVNVSLSKIDSARSTPQLKDVMGNFYGQINKIKDYQDAVEEFQEVRAEAIESINSALHDALDALQGFWNHLKRVKVKDVANRGILRINDLRSIEQIEELSEEVISIIQDTYDY